MSSLPLTTAAVDYLRCPLCEDFTGSGWTVECEGNEKIYHPLIRLSWQWNSFAEYEAMYASEDYHTKMQEEGGQKPYDTMDRYLSCQRQATSRLGLIVGMKPDMGRILDVGAGNMAFVEMCRSWGYSAVGIDPHPMSRILPEGFACGGLTADKGTWKDIRAEQWGLITLWDVFEHLIKPRECLRHLKQCLTDDGMIAIETPEWNGPLHLKEGEKWRHHRPKQHPMLYSKEAIEQLYAEEGLEVVLFCRPKSGHAGKMTHFLMKKEE